MKELKVYILKYKLPIILFLVSVFILSCHCMKSLDIFNLKKLTKQKEDDKVEGFSCRKFMNRK
jgi:hypothetical protein